MNSTQKSNGSDNNSKSVKAKLRKRSTRKPDKKKSQAVNHVKSAHFIIRDINSFPNCPKKFFVQSKEVATFHDDCIHIGTIPNEPTIPTLHQNISQLRDNNMVSYKRTILGANLFEGFEEHRPLTEQELDDSSPCFKFHDEMKTSTLSESYSGNMIISPRHHIVDIIMSLFNEDKFSIICTHFDDGKFLLSTDNTKKPTKEVKRSTMLKKIIYSGTALERELTHKNTKPFFSIVEGHIDSNLKLLLRCEMDAINEVDDIYTELKCYSRLNLHNIHHRRKLLKTWIQISLVPDSDLIIGLRDQGGILRDLMWYSKQHLYQTLSNPFLPRNKQYKNFNPNVAVSWFHYSFKKIIEMISIDITEPHNPKSFKLEFDNNGTIKTNKLDYTPISVSTMIEKYKLKDNSNS